MLCMFMQELSPYSELQYSATEVLLSPAHHSEDEGEGEAEDDEAGTSMVETPTRDMSNWMFSNTAQMDSRIERVSYAKHRALLDCGRREMKITKSDS